MCISKTMSYITIALYSGLQFSIKEVSLSPLLCQALLSPLRTVVHIAVLVCVRQAALELSVQSAAGFLPLLCTAAVWLALCCETLWMATNGHVLGVAHVVFSELPSITDRTLRRIRLFVLFKHIIKSSKHGGKLSFGSPGTLAYSVAARASKPKDPLNG